MYIPTAFREDRLDVLHQIMRDNSFITLVSTGADGLIATHLPIMLDERRGSFGTLVGHVARENPHWRSFTGEQDTLAIFQGPHAYVSPSWYTTSFAVPTWNYVAVHAYGRPRIVEDEARLYEIVADLVKAFERQFAYAWDLDARREYAQKLLKNIVGFEIEITRLEGKCKLSQNRSHADQEGVIAGLTGRGEPLDLALAQLMSANL